MIVKRPLSSVHSSASRVQGPTSRIQSPILASRVQGFRYAQEIRGLLPWLFERCLYLELFSSAFSNIWTRITPNTDTFNVVHKNIKYFCCFIHLLMKMLPSKMLQKPFFFFFVLSKSGGLLLRIYTKFLSLIIHYIFSIWYITPLYAPLFCTLQLFTLKDCCHVNNIFLWKCFPGVKIRDRSRKFQKPFLNFQLKNTKNVEFVKKC